MSFLHRRLLPALVLTTLAAPFAACTHSEEAQVVLEARLSGQLVISQVYGGGGNASATYTNDFIEIFNRSTSAVSLNGLSVQYASAAGNFQASQTLALPNVNLEAGQYFLVQLGSGGAMGTALPTPDLTGTINMSGSAGKVALVDGTTVVPCTTGVCTLTNVIDLVGYGSTASQYEGAASAIAPSNNTTSVQRRGAGCIETDDNRADFESPVLAVAPRNTATARNVCASTGTDAGTDAADVIDAAADVVDVVDSGPPMDSGTDAGSDGGTVVVPNGLVISQVYGAGGNAGAAYTNDFVELFNLSSAPISLNGLSIQYASSAGNFQMSNVVALPDVVVPPGHYFLVSLAGGATGAALPTADLSNTAVNMASGAGRVALVAGTTAIPCTAGVCTLTNVVDYVGYGATASQYEGTGAAPAPSMSTQSMQRRGAGCVDTNDNAADFEVLAAAPRNSASAANDCSMVTTDAGTDAGVDASADADDGSTTDAGSDAGLDTGTGTDSGSSMDATVDAGPIDATGLVISQVYGGGGNASAAYTNDFVEIFNRGTMPISLNGLSVQYASSAGNFQASGVTVLPAATIPAGGYFLVQLASSGAVGLALPGSDFSNTTVNLSGSAGKVALVIGTTALGCGGTTLCAGTNIVDLVGYGSAATAYEGTGPAGAASSNTNSVQRLRAGCVDTNDNSVDFEMPTRAATPRWSGSPLNDCSITPPVDAGPMDTGVDVPMVDAARDTGTDVPRVDVVDVATDVPRDVPTTDVPATDTGVDSGVDAGTPDAGTPDSGRVDAGGTDARADAARDARPDAGNTMNPSGCGCSTPGTEHTRSPFALFAAVAMAGAIRRRRRIV